MNKVVTLPKAKGAKAKGAADNQPESVSDNERPSYNGGLSAEELLRPGGKLLAMLVARANQLGMKLADMATQELGVTYGYIHQLRSGLRSTVNISPQFATRCAIFLGVPRLTVLMASGLVSVEDYFARGKMAAAEIRRAMQYVMEDPEFGVDMHPDVMDLQLSSQFAIITLYEKATGRKLLPPDSITMDSLVQQLSNLDEAVAQLREEAKAKTAGAEAESTEA